MDSSLPLGILFDQKDADLILQQKLWLVRLVFVVGKRKVIFTMICFTSVIIAWGGDTPATSMGEPSYC